MSTETETQLTRLVERLNDAVRELRLYHNTAIALIDQLERADSAEEIGRICDALIAWRKRK